MNNPFHQTDRQHLAQLWHKTDDALRLGTAGGNPHRHILRLIRRQQQHIGLAVHYLDLRPGSNAVAVRAARAELVSSGAGHLDAAAGRFHRNHGFAFERLALVIEHADAETRRSLSIRRQTVLIDFHPNHADLAILAIASTFDLIRIHLRPGGQITVAAIQRRQRQTVLIKPAVSVELRGRRVKIMARASRILSPGRPDAHQRQSQSGVAACMAECLAGRSRCQFIAHGRLLGSFPNPATVYLVHCWCPAPAACSRHP